MEKLLVVKESEHKRLNQIFAGLLGFSIVSSCVIVYFLFNPIVKHIPTPEKVVYKPAYLPSYQQISADEFRQLNCMALNVYHEARGELLAGRYASAHSVMNRINDEKFPDNACDVVYQKIKGVAQYSWVSDGLSDKATDEKSWFDALSVSYDVLFLNAKDITEGSLFYHRNDPNTRFSDKHYQGIEVTGLVGKHIFFRRKAK